MGFSVKKVKLSECADVRSGLVLARKQSAFPTDNNYKLITLKSINPQGYIDVDLLEDYYATEKLNNDFITRPGDMVVRISSPYTAVLIDDLTRGFVISSYFTIIRTNKNLLRPDYLYWLLNNEETYRHIQKNNFGNILGSIRPQFFSDMEIFLFPITEQIKIAQINLLSTQERYLLQKLQVKKELQKKLILEKHYEKLKGNK